MSAASSLLGAFEEHDLVCIGEAHELEDLAVFLAALLREPGFSDTVNDIVVECGNSRYQQVADRFVAGDEVPPADLLRIWRDTTQPGAWDSPIYGQFFVKVREANRALAPGRRTRIVLADVPIDWANVNTPAEFAAYAALREAHFAGILETEVLRKGRKAIFWAGSSHVLHRPMSIPNPVVLIDRRGTGRVFSTLTHVGFADEALETRLAAWPAPSLLRLESTWFGRLEASTLFPAVKGHRTSNPYAGVKLEDAADAYLFLGDRGSLTWVAAPEDIYEDDYGAELRRRRGLIAGLAGLVR